MLVRFLKIDQRMNDLFRELVFRYGHSFDPIFSKIDIFEIHEGRGTIMKHGDQERKDETFESVAEYQIKAEEHSTFGFKEFDDFARSLGAQFLDSKKKNLVETMNKITEETGNIIGRRGQPLDHDVIFEAIQLMEIDFDEHGEPSLPSIIIPPNLAPRMEQLGKEAETDREVKKRYDQLINQKREEFLAREATRKLAG